MTGDLYQCLMILETPDTGKYSAFLEYAKRIVLEDELESKIRATKEFSRLNIGIHPILDINKTERQLRVIFKGRDEPVIIGNVSSKKLLIGVFIKNEPYGLSHVKFSFGKKESKLIDIIIQYFTSYFENGVKVIPLYEEADNYGK